MASNTQFVASRAYTSMPRTLCGRNDQSSTLSLKNTTHRITFPPVWRIYPWKLSARRRSMVAARLSPEARGKTNETVGSDSGVVVAEKSVEQPIEVTESTRLLSSIGTANMPPVSVKHWNLTDQHLFVLTMIACVTGGAVTALFVAAIPTLLAFKRAAESLEKLLDVTREELPGTMAAVRLSGMEISDLTMELSELGQEISSGVKSSARAVRAAQDGLRRVSSIASMAFLQEHTTVPVESMKPGVALAARNLRERLKQARTIFHGIVTLKHLTGWIGRYWIMRKMQKMQKKQLPGSTAHQSFKIQHAKTQ